MLPMAQHFGRAVEILLSIPAGYARPCWLNSSKKCRALAPGSPIARKPRLHFDPNAGSMPEPEPIAPGDGKSSARCLGACCRSWRPLETDAGNHGGPAPPAEVSFDGG